METGKTLNTIFRTKGPNHALPRTQPAQSGCNRCVSRVGSLIPPRYTAHAHLLAFLRLAFFVVVLVAELLSAEAQSFVNLNFESTTITTVSYPGGDRFFGTVPG